jgi:hypothetical protein
VFGPGTVIGDAAVKLLRALGERLGIELEEPAAVESAGTVSVGDDVS